MAQTTSPLSPLTASPLLKKLGLGEDPAKTQAHVTRRLEKGKRRLDTWKPRWAEALAFYQGRQFVYRAQTVGNQGLFELPTLAWTDSEGKNKARSVRNRYMGFVISEVSMGTQRVPGYEVTPTTTDPHDITAARLSERVLLHLYDQLRLRRHLIDAWTYAVNCGEGFIRPYWDPTLGEPLPPQEDPDTGEPEHLYEGKLCLEAYGPHEVYWEPGCTFDESPWHAIEKARSLEQAKQTPGLLSGANLKPDSTGYASFVQGQLSKGNADGDCVLVTEYLELPSRANPKGLRLFVANGNPITMPEPYPMSVTGEQGYEPCLHKMTYIPTPDRDRDMGLGEHLVDPQRTLNDAVSKAVAWKNLGIVPQWLSPKGAFGQRQRLTNEPGAIFEYFTVGGQKPEQIRVEPIPDSLFKMADQAISDMEEIASQRTPPSQIDSSKSLSAWVERDASRRQFIVQALADFHSRLGRHLLHYVARYYTEPQTLAITGSQGVDYEQDFKGVLLRDQFAVRVLPGSIEPRTRQAIEQKIMSYAQLGWISGKEAMAAIEGGTAEALDDEYEFDVARARRENEQLMALGDDQMSGGDVPIAEPYDDHTVHIHTHNTWFKTRQFEESHGVVKFAASKHIEQHQMLEAQDRAREATEQIQTAQGLGMSNAAKPTTAPMPSMPSMPGLNGPQGA